MRRFDERQGFEDVNQQYVSYLMPGAITSHDCAKGMFLPRTLKVVVIVSRRGPHAPFRRNLIVSRASLLLTLVPQDDSHPTSEWKTNCRPRLVRRTIDLNVRSSEVVISAQGLHRYLATQRYHEEDPHNEPLQSTTTSLRLNGDTYP